MFIFFLMTSMNMGVLRGGYNLKKSRKYTYRYFKLNYVYSRSYDASCNNLENSLWGTSNSAFQEYKLIRFIPSFRATDPDPDL